eukprot:TRINITY_DN8533_c0_g1_i1.p1 TRINITY_DN8533_c0_g1~~TRINITY_DN8533_c0_g1_i1.p1  ORF type:complete len:281 (+),score=51.75 TRINITY_DN8533_c0_g1_i1:37-843(+)
MAQQLPEPPVAPSVAAESPPLPVEPLQTNEVPTPRTEHGEEEREEKVLPADDEGLSQAEGEKEDKVGPSHVIVHIYHCDPYTGWLNTYLLKGAELGIYHAGVEVYGEEWSFQYFEDTWNDPSVSGVRNCRPTRMHGYDYQESVNLGKTSLSGLSVRMLLINLREKWPACSYHITHNNCLTFAETLVAELSPPGKFPARLKGILELSHKTAPADAMVDYSWSWMKWWMVRNNQREAEQEEREAMNNDRRADYWSMLWAPTRVCVGVRSG